MTSVWSFAQIIYTPIIYYSNHWRIICIGVIGIPFLASFFLASRNLFETPRYLISKKRFDEARIILNKIALYNRRPKFNYKIEGETEEIELQDSKSEFFKKDSVDHKIKKKNYNYVDLFKYKSLRTNTIFMFFLWFFRYFCYYGLAFSLPALGGEMHQNFLIIAVAEFAACLISGKIKKLK